MPVLKIAQLGQPVLRRRAEDVSPDELATPEFQALLDSMYETLRHANGAGLAAPQVFESRRVFLAHVKFDKKDENAEAEVFINPVISHRSADMDAGWEGCLSFMELSVLVPRHRSIQVDYIDREGNQRRLKLEGFPARVVQHENDHLNGVLIIDRATSTHDIVKTSEIDAVLNSSRFQDEDDDDTLQDEPADN